MAKRERRRKSICFNCDSKLRASDNYCFNCGQENHDKKVSVSLLLNDFAGDYLTFDSKVLRSLASVVFKPGLLASEYADGKRTRYVKPIRLFLFISFIYFLLLNLTAQNTNMVQTSAGGESSGFNFTLGDNTNNETSSTREAVDSLDQVIADSMSTPEQKLKASNMKLEMVSASDEFVRMAMKAFSYCFLVMAPLLALIFLLFFHRKRRFYVEHLVLSLNVHSVMFVLLTLSLGISYLFPQINYLSIGVFVIMLVHTGFAIRRMYQSNWGYISLTIVLSLVLYFALFILVLVATIYLLLLFTGT